MDIPPLDERPINAAADYDARPGRLQVANVQEA
jgi:hypothetical protein